MRRVPGTCPASNGLHRLRQASPCRIWLPRQSYRSSCCRTRRCATRACWRRLANCVRASCRSHRPSWRRTTQGATTRRRRCCRARPRPGMSRRGGLPVLAMASARGAHLRAADHRLPRVRRRAPVPGAGPGPAQHPTDPDALGLPTDVPRPTSMSIGLRRVVRRYRSSVPLRVGGRPGNTAHPGP